MEETAMPGEAGEGFQHVALPAGDYRIEIPHLQGSQQMATLSVAVELPANATAGFAVT